MTRPDGDLPTRPRFATTRAALSELCEIYWGPVYSFVRRRGYDTEEAHDHTQTFFARLLEAGSFEGVDQSRGRFRAWLLGGCEHFLSNASIISAP